MKKRVIIILVLLAKTTGLNAQFQISYSEQLSYIKVENVVDIPNVVNNEDGTVALSQQDENIA